MTTMTVEHSVHDPVSVEKKIEELSGRIARGVSVVTAAEREAKARRRDFDLAYAQAYKRAEGSIKEREYTADIQTMDKREEVDNAEIAFKHAIRTADSLDKELFAWQAILKSVVAMFGAAGVRS